MDYKVVSASGIVKSDNEGKKFETLTNIISSENDKTMSFNSPSKPRSIRLLFDKTVELDSILVDLINVEAVSISIGFMNAHSNLIFWKEEVICETIKYTEEEYAGQPSLKHRIEVDVAQWNTLRQVTEENKQVNFCEIVIERVKSRGHKNFNRDEKESLGI